MAIEDAIDLEAVSDFTGLSKLETKHYKARYNGIVKVLKEIETLKGANTVDVKKVQSKRRELIARLVTDPSAYKSEASWSKIARIAENDQVHHKMPLNRFSRITYSYRPRDIVKLHQYLADREIFLGSHPRNAISLHEVTHKGSIQAKPGEQGSREKSAHPRGTNEGTPFKFDTPQTPLQRAEEILNISDQYRKDVEGVFVDGGLEYHRRQNLTKNLLEQAASRGFDFQELVDSGVDILDPVNRSVLPDRFKNLAAWLSGENRISANRSAGEMFGIKMQMVDPFLGAPSEALKRSPAMKYALANAILTNTDLQDAILKGNYKQAANTAAKDAAIGLTTDMAVTAGGKVLKSKAPSLATSVVPAVAKIASPIGAAAVGTELFNQGRADSFTTKIVNKASNYVPGLKADAKTDIGKKTGDFLVTTTNTVAKKLNNEATYFFARLRQGKIPYVGD